jgi:hypothetical protein
MLWTLLIATSSFTFVYGAVATARDAKAGIAGYALVITIGLLLAVGNAWTWTKLADIVTSFLKPYSDSRQEKWLHAMYFAAGAWILFAAFLSHWVSSAMMWPGA